MYYGEELGMETMPFDQLKSVPTGPKRPRADDRDGERTPMQWDDTSHAGFTKGSPWLPIESTAQCYNVAKEEADSNSIYNWYAQLLKLRHENPALRNGDYVPLESSNPNVFAFGRKAGTESTVLIVLNTSNQEQAVTISGWDQWPNFRKVLLASPSIAAPASQKMKVAPYGVFIAGSH